MIASLRRPYLLLCLAASCAPAFFLFADQIPVAPLHPQTDDTGGEIYRIQAGKLTVTVSPAKGGVVSIQTADEGELLQSPIHVSSSSQAPSRPWRHRGWETSEGASVVMLSRSMGPPLSLRVVHLIEIPADGQSLRQVTRITATGPGNPDLIRPAADWRVSPADTLWTRAEADEACGGWTQAPPRHSDTPYRVLGYPGLFAYWSCDWEVEEPEQLLKDAKLRFTATDGEFHSQPGERDVPAQGWTLICDLRLKLTRPSPGVPPCEVLTSWSPRS